MRIDLSDHIEEREAVEAKATLPAYVVESIRPRYWELHVLSE